MNKFFSLAVLLCLFVAGSYAQEVPVPVNVQLSLFTKIVTFDRNFKARSGDAVVVGILYQSKYRRSLNVKDEVVNVLSNGSTMTIEGVPIHYVPIDLDKMAGLDEVFDSNRLHYLYVAPLRAIDISALAAHSRSNRVKTFTGVPDYCEMGIAVGIGLKAERPQIVINLPSAKSEGSDFNSQLLKLAKVLQ